MKYEKSQNYNKFMNMIMGPNPIKLLEELMLNNATQIGKKVMDLGSGTGLTSVFLAKEYGFCVWAADLWSEPKENQEFFSKCGLLEEQIKAVKADATVLPFKKAFFDAVVSVDSYNYFGRDENYLDEKLLPFVKSGGYIYVAVPGMKKDCHNNLPKELLLSWTPEQMEYMRDVAYWRNLVDKCKGAEVVSVKEMQSNDEVWQDWLNCDNEYAINDRKSMNAGAGKYLNFIKIILKKK